MLKHFIVATLAVSVTFCRKASLERVLKDIQFGRFIANEFNYTHFLNKADYSAEKIVPFQDTSNDTLFRVGIIHRTQLDNYTKINMNEHLGDIKNKPWLPLQHIREEMAACTQYKYGSVSENDFKYDKGLYGWFNIMKFSCAEVNEGFIVFAMAFSRTRFRLKQVYLRRQNKYWATSGRSIITRDLQKIVEIFSIQYSNFVTEKLADELKVMNGPKVSKKKEKLISALFLRLDDPTHKELSQLFPPILNHTSSVASRGHTFNTIAVPVKTRLIIAKVNQVNGIVENLSNELSDEGCETLDSCSKITCTYDNLLNDTYNAKTETHNYSKERVLSHKVTPVDTLLAFQVSRPYFKFDTMKRKTSQGIVDVKQHLDEEAMLLWESLLDQQFAVAIRMHSQHIFQPVRGDDMTTNLPWSSSREVEMGEVDPIE